MTHFVANTPVLVGFGYPAGWISCCVVEVIYWLVRWKGKTSGDIGLDPVEVQMSGDTGFDLVEGQNEE